MQSNGSKILMEGLGLSKRHTIFIIFISVPERHLVLVPLVALLIVFLELSGHFAPPGHKIRHVGHVTVALLLGMRKKRARHVLFGAARAACCGQLKCNMDIERRQQEAIQRLQEGMWFHAGHVQHLRGLGGKHRSLRCSGTSPLWFWNALQKPVAPGD